MRSRSRSKTRRRKQEEARGGRREEGADMLTC